MRIPRANAFLGISLLAGLAAGCSSDDRKPVFAVAGQVLYEGQPTPHALVTLHPLDPADKSTPRPHGSVGPDGRFTLTTYRAGDGAPPGEYGVTVEWWLTSARAGTPEGDSLPPTNRLPPRYARVETSNIRVRIEAGDNQLPVFKLSR